MKSVFVDTSALVALFYEEDQNHQRSKHILDRLMKTRIAMVLTDYIFDETITGILSSIGHDAAVRAGEFILSSAVIDLVWLDESMKSRAWEYFRKHDDKAFSFTDCTSFVLMKEMNVKQYFSFDDDFRQAGFVPFS